jgi:hypothetical protein
VPTFATGPMVAAVALVELLFGELKPALSAHWMP